MVYIAFESEIVHYFISYCVCFLKKFLALVTAHNISQPFYIFAKSDRYIHTKKLIFDEVPYIVSYAFSEKLSI